MATTLLTRRRHGNRRLPKRRQISISAVGHGSAPPARGWRRLTDRTAHHSTRRPVPRGAIPGPMEEKSLDSAAAQPSLRHPEGHSMPRPTRRPTAEPPHLAARRQQEDAARTERRAREDTLIREHHRAKTVERKVEDRRD